MADVLSLNAVEARAALDAGDVSAPELTGAYLAAIEETGALNNYVAVTAAKAMEMAITGDNITAYEALEFGLLSQTTEDGAALDAAVALAERIAKNAPLAVAASKKLVKAAAQGYDEAELWAMQGELVGKVFGSNDAKEGPKAFAEKREPNWTGT